MRIEVIPTMNGICKHTTGASVNDEVECFQPLLVDETATIVLSEGRPVTVWKVAAKLGDGYVKQVLAILDRLTASGTLAKFRAGFNNYYASPKAALTEEVPTLRTVILDSLLSLILTCGYKVKGN